ncbi:glycosyltransferase family 2 protein [Segnochrobactrum spirostomi]|uniref:Glycosyltransferase family 2 protein n=1 Tax=Segnochrobactrum spirostomi TaxID=2608987 RepID=A0A6A7Y7F6_9HYPH|nr:glycosyltransferase family 2 protein [Segnochrobactrum spirostomi]MQT13459.1 glycosyltransferase family 2 protein [Segnochrobactrum spirostomi]
MSGADAVAVVIATFRRPDAVRRAVASVLAQTAPVGEIVVVDDASPTPAPSFDDARVRVLRRTENGGQGAAYRDGLAAVRRPLVAFLDDDDLWRPDKIARQLTALAGAADPERTIVSCAVETLRDGRRHSLPRRPPRSDEPLADYLFVAGGVLQQSTLLGPTALARRAAFDPGVRRHQDLGFILRAERLGAGVVLVEAPLVLWGTTARDRLSTVRDPTASLAWLATEPALTPQQRAGFLARHAAIGAPPLVGLGRIAVAAACGALDLREAAALASRRVLPERLGRPLRRVGRGLLGAPVR